MAVWEEANGKLRLIDCGGSSRRSTNPMTYIRPASPLLTASFPDSPWLL